ncbi:NAD-dependent epimerase/dehydratase family protein [bacterium]|nr:NAD-dependent epimerase/dehydratase family protein [bacterium]
MKYYESSQRVLVLGGAGFLGCHIVRKLLEAGYSVRVLTRKPSPKLLAGLPLELVYGDLQDSEVLENALKGCDVLIHSAGYYPIYSMGRKQQLRQAELQVNNIKRALQQHPVDRFIYVSAPTAVGRYPDGAPEDENAPWQEWRRFSLYAEIKRSMQEKFLQSASRTNLVTVVPTGIFGEFDHKPTTGRLVLEYAARWQPFTFAGRTNVVDVRDVAKGIMQALESGQTGKLYVLGGINLGIPDFTRKIARLADQRPPSIVVNPKTLIPLSLIGEITGKILKRPKPLLPLVGIHFAMTGEYLSSEVAKREIGYKPTRTIDPAIMRALEWYTREGYLIR